MKRSSLLIPCIGVALVAGCQMKHSTSEATSKPGSDPAIQQILQEITRRQPQPYALPENHTFNYIWAQYMMAFLAAERCGYLSHDEAVARIGGMLDAILPLERYHGFLYDSYDLDTGRKTTDKIYFQGWWLFSLPILKHAYPELAERCQQLMDEVDYIKGGMYDPETAILATDHWPTSNKVIWVDFYDVSSGEIRSPAVAYTYYTGDISPWIKPREPAFTNLYGHKVLNVYHNFYFCTMLMHSVFPDFGYYDRSWDEMCAGLELYRRDNGMLFYPTRAESMAALHEPGSTNWPNTEHRLAKPWLAWHINPEAPVMEKSFIPGHGVTLFYDNMNFYWSYGGPTTMCEYVIGTDIKSDYVCGTLQLPFNVYPATDNPQAPNQVELVSLKLVLSCDSGAHQPNAPLVVHLDDQPIGQIDPAEIQSTPTELLLTFTNLSLTGIHHEIRLATDATGNAYHIYRSQKDIWDATYEYKTASGAATLEKVHPPLAEITLNGQHRGGENPFALLARCSEIHGYYPWQELLNDPRFLSNTVVWVGDYHNQARVGQVIHNTSDQAVEVEYERPAQWISGDNIRIIDITDNASTPVEHDITHQLIIWEALPGHTYRISYADETMGVE